MDRIRSVRSQEGTEQPSEETRCAIETFAHRPGTPGTREGRELGDESFEERARFSVNEDNPAAARTRYHLRHSYFAPYSVLRFLCEEGYVLRYASLVLKSGSFLCFVYESSQKLLG